MPGARHVTLDVKIISIDPLEFSVLPSPKNKPQLPTKVGSKPGQPVIEFHNNAHKGFDIEFVLQDDTHGFFFPPDPKDACWSQCGTICPEKTGAWDVLEPKQVLIDPASGERRILIVHNANPPSPPAPAPQGPFMYNLRVTDGKDWKNLDPGGDNTDGSYRSSTHFATYAFVAVAAAAVAAVALFRLGVFGA